MNNTPKNLRKYLPQAIITALTIFALGFLLNPISKILDSLLNDFSTQAKKLLIIQLCVGLLIILFGFVAYLFFLRKRFHFKKQFKFGVYWDKKNRAYCPSCGGSLKFDALNLLKCKLCGEKHHAHFEGKTISRETIYKKLHEEELP